MKKTLFKVSTFVIAIIIAVSSFSFGAFADTPDLYKMENVKIDNFCIDYGWSGMYLYMDTDMKDLYDADGIYLSCNKKFTSDKVEGFICNIGYDEENSCTSSYIEFYSDYINPYDYYDFVISEGTFGNDDGDFVNEEYTIEKIPGYKILSEKKPFMFEFVNVLRNFFSFIIK